MYLVSNNNVLNYLLCSNPQKFMVSPSFNTKLVHICIISFNSMTQGWISIYQSVQYHI
jgi:hypothetical protein